MTRYSAAVERWAEAIARCMICGAPHWVVEREQIGGLQKMHIVPRSKRRCDEVDNLILGCSRCHAAQHTGVPDRPDLTIEHLLYVKLTSDPDHWNPDKLEYLFCRRLPFPMPLPTEYLEERMRYHP